MELSTGMMSSIILGAGGILLGIFQAMGRRELKRLEDTLKNHEEGIKEFHKFQHKYDVDSQKYQSDHDMDHVTSANEHKDVHSSTDKILGQLSDNSMIMDRRINELTLLQKSQHDSTTRDIQALQKDMAKISDKLTKHNAAFASNQGDLQRLREETGKAIQEVIAQITAPRGRK